MTVDATAGIYLAGPAVFCSSLECPDPIDRFAAAGIQAAGKGHGYVAKFDLDGKLQWVRLGGKAQTGIAPRLIVVDKDQNYYIAGWYSHTIEFDGYILPQAVDYNLFLAKYDQAGVLQWARAGEATDFANMMGLAVDDSGNLFVCGLARGTLSFLDLTLTRPFSYIIKFSPDGKPLWAKETGLELNLETSGAKLAVDRYGNSFVATESTENTIALSKYSPDGELMWTRLPKGSARVTEVVVDERGNCFLGGSYGQKDELTFDAVRLKTVARRDIFAAKYTGSGVLRWAVSSTGRDPETNFASRISETSATSFSVDSGGGIHFFGQFLGTVTFGGTTLIGPPNFPAASFAAHVSDPDELPPSLPSLQITTAAGAVVLSWPASTATFVLEKASSLTTPDWSRETNAVAAVGETLQVTITLEKREQFFRLRE